MSVLLVDIFESFLGESRKHNETTGQVSFDCPVCSEEKGMPNGDGKGNLEINYNIGKYNCWSCGQTNDMHGSVLALIKKFGKSKNIKDYLILRPNLSLTEKKDLSDFILKLPDEFKPFKTTNPNSFMYSTALNYLTKRGINKNIINHHNIGYISDGQYNKRILVPSYDEYGEINYFVTRSFDKKIKPKYLNPLEPKKSDIIFNIGKINWDADVTLVEGVFDHIVVPNSIPLLGKYVTPLLLNKLNDNLVGNITVMLDGDAIKEVKEICSVLNIDRLRDRVKYVELNEDYDPSSIYEKFGYNGILHVLRNAKKFSY